MRVKESLNGGSARTQRNPAHTTKRAKYAFAPSSCGGLVMYCTYITTNWICSVQAIIYLC